MPPGLGPAGIMAGMPRVVLLAIGSRGDVVPMVALAEELQDRGHDVLVLAHPEYVEVALARNVPCVSLRAGLVEHADDQRRAQILVGNPVSAAIALQGWQMLISATVAPVLMRHLRSDDVLITGVVGVASALALAEDRGCTPVHVTFSATLPTAEPMAVVSPVTTGPNKLLGLWTRHGVWTGSLAVGRPLERALRRRLRLRWRSPWAVSRRALSIPTLVAASHVLLPPPPDWPENAVVTGAWELSGEPEPGDESLSAWLRINPSTIYVGFGSMLSSNPASDLQLIDAAARAAGVTVVHRPDDSAPPLQSTSAVHIVRDADHRWLLPRCGAVIHHGGAGTTNAALSAGVPSAIVAHGFDQPFHGRRLHELGVGPKQLKRRGLTVAALAKLFWDISHGPQRAGYVERAAAVACEMAREDGVVAAADWLAAAGLLDDS